MYLRFTLFSLTTLLAIALLQTVWPPIIWLLLLIVPLIALGLYDLLQKKHSLKRNFPLFGRGRWFMEWMRPFIRQYFIESDTDGTPVSRMFRSIIYQRAKGQRETVPFGTHIDTYRTGYEWIGHSLSAINPDAIVEDMRITVGGPDCRQPYDASIFNISAMSFGALSKNAIRALNGGAKKGNFYHNTGEGGISPYHLDAGGDLVWQIGTGYFGCRDRNGRFSAEAFREKAVLPSVRMIEIKISQGAKPGHGGILPADKNTPEIAAIRGVKAGTVIDSPATHSAFGTPIELLDFIAQLRKLSDGKPVGFKLCIGRKSEFIAICKAMVETGIMPDFITIDGGEGGTGAAPLEFSNSIGMPLRESIAFVDSCLTGFGVREHIRIIAAGKIFTGFHLVKNLALGADICNSARGMMMALGCVQSLVCNSNHCPTGIATQSPLLYRGLVVSDKTDRVARFHHRTIHSTAEIVASAGLDHTTKLTRTHIYRRISQEMIRRYDEIYPYVAKCALLSDAPPETWRLYLEEATSKSFLPKHILTKMNEQQAHSEADLSNQKPEIQEL